MIIKRGRGTTIYGTGVEVHLTGSEVATAIDAYLVAHGIYVDGPRTVRVNGELCKFGEVYVDPEGSIIYDGVKYNEKRN